MHPRRSSVGDRRPVDVDVHVNVHVDVRVAVDCFFFLLCIEYGAEEKRSPPIGRRCGVATSNQFGRKSRSTTSRESTIGVSFFHFVDCFYFVTFVLGSSMADRLPIRFASAVRRSASANETGRSARVVRFLLR